jgi:hypothetical protein
MIGTLWQDHKLTLGALAALAVVALTSVVEVDETEQAVVLRNGAPTASSTSSSRDRITARPTRACACASLSLKRWCGWTSGCSRSNSTASWSFHPISSGWRWMPSRSIA